MVCAELYSMTASYLLNDTDAFNLCISPETTYTFTDCKFLMLILGAKSKDSELPNPYYDYVDSDLLSLFITDFGPHSKASLGLVFDSIRD